MSPKWIFIEDTANDEIQVVYFAFDGTNDNNLGGFGSVYDSEVGGEFFE